MLDPVDPLVVLYVLCGRTQDNLFHNLPKHQGQSDRPEVPQMNLLETEASPIVLL